jgi:hypothetical protein
MGPTLPTELSAFPMRAWNIARLERESLSRAEQYSLVDVVYGARRYLDQRAETLNHKMKLRGRRGLREGISWDKPPCARNEYTAH